MKLWDKIEISPEGCWLWTGAARNRHGYGGMRSGGKIRLTHVLAYEWLFGPVPDGMELDHVCRCRRCANPLHLEPVLHRTNILRGQGLAAKNALKTHCKNGHPLEGENLYRDSEGKRGCRICVNEYNRKWRAKNANRN